jgi:hypothetical protein
MKTIYAVDKNNIEIYISKYAQTKNFIIDRGVPWHD